jgi:hypothetical protein
MALTQVDGGNGLKKPIDLADNERARFGAGNDLQIYHDGSNSYIADTGTGKLFIRGNSQLVLESNNGENYLAANENGDVHLYYDGGVRISTKSDGANIVGELECDSLDVDGQANINGIQVSENVTPTSGSGVEIFKPSAFSGQVQAYNRDSNAWMDFKLKGNNLQFFANNSERLRIDSSGNALIGTTSNARGKLTIFNGDDFSTGTLNNGDNIYLVSDATSGNNVYGASIAFSRVQYPDRKAAAIASVQTSTDEDHVGLAFFTHPSSNASDAIVEAMRVDSAGRLLVGLTSSTGSHALEVNGGTDNEPIKVESSDAGAYVRFEDNDTTGSTRLGAVDNDFKIDVNSAERLRIDSSGTIFVGPSNSTHNTIANTSQSAELELSGGGGGCGVIKIFGASHSGHSKEIHFFTDSAERMRIHTTGRVLLGRAISADPWGATGNVDAGQYFGSGNNFGAAFNSRNIPLILNRTNSTGTIQEFKYNGQITGWVNTTSTGISINYSSDYRLKENVIPLADAVTRVKQLQPKRFNYIIDPGVTVDGFLAHEAQTVVPEAVVGTHNQVDDNGDPVYQGIDPSKMIPLLTAALQEAIAKIETLETKVAALEAAA